MEYLQFFPKEKGEQFIVRKALRNGWKRVCSVILAAAMVITMLPVNTQAATSSSDNGDGTFSNPVIYADVPDIDIIRVGDAYYMVSTTMHLSPGCPIMKSTDLVNWEIVNYVYDILGDTDAMNLRNGESMYGNGQWAASLKYHNGTYYAAFNAEILGEAYIFTTKDIENGSWEKHVLKGNYKDLTLFFDNNKTYIVYGNKEIKCAELGGNFTVAEGTEKALFTIDENTVSGDAAAGLEAEGTHILKKDGYYYVFHAISSEKMGRAQLCHRTQNFLGGKWENKIIFQGNFDNNGGVARGGVIDTAAGKWYGYLMQEHGAAGQVPVLTECTWTENWPMLGKNGDGQTIDKTMQLVSASDGKSLVKSDEFYNSVKEEETVSVKAPVYKTAKEAGKTGENTTEELEEFVSNGDFEKDSLEGWSSIGWPAGTKIERAQDPLNAQNHVLKIFERTSSGGSAAFDLSGKLQAGKEYVLTGKILYQEGPDTTSFPITFQNGPDYNFNETLYGKITGKKGEWSEFEVRYTPKAGDKFTTSRNVFMIEGSYKEGETDKFMDLYLDDISVKGPKIVAEETVEYVGNGDFEQDSLEGWSSIGWPAGTKIERAQDPLNAQNHVLKIFERTSSGGSAAFDLSGKLQAGKEYVLTGKILYQEGPDTTSFPITFQNGPDYNFNETLYGKITGKKGEWSEFEVRYTPKAGDKFTTSRNVFMIEGSYKEGETDKFMDLYLDDISVKGPKLPAEEEKPGGDTEEPGDEEDPAFLIQLFSNGDAERGSTVKWMTTPGETACKLEAVETEKAGGKYSIQVSERKSTGAGACQDVSGKLEENKTYTISGKIKYNGDADSRKFNITIQNGKDYNYREVVCSVDAKKGEWTSFKGTYQVHDKDAEHKFDPEKNYVFIETPAGSNDTGDYYLDDFSMTTPPESIIADGSFQSGTVGEWKPFGPTKLTIAADGHGDDKCLSVTERSLAWHAAGIQLDRKLVQGTTYQFTAYVKYTEGANAEQAFNVTIRGGEGDNTKFQGMASGKAKKGQWTKITGKWTMPTDASDIQFLYFDVPDPTLSYFIDDVSLYAQVDKEETSQPGENDNQGSNLDNVWQWNHNPNNNNWSLTERNGWLRLTTGNKTTGLLGARNTLTQRTFGPACSGKIRMDISGMRSGDVAGLAAFTYDYGYIAVKKDFDGAKLVMVDASGNSKAGMDAPVEKASAECTENIVYLKEEFNFAGKADGSEKDTVSFYYSFDGNAWTKLGETMQMAYDKNHSMASRFAIFNYATRAAGGYADFDYFRVSDQLTGAGQSSALNAAMTATQEITGVMNSECEVKLNLDALAAGNHSSLKASLSIPDLMRVEDVVFNQDAIKGDASYTYKNGRLLIDVKGNDVSFNAADKLFATIKLQMKGYVDEDKTVSVAADYIMVDDGALDYNVGGCSASVKLKYLDTKALAKKLGYGNPITTQEFGADPYAIIYDGRVYVYMTADAYQYAEKDVVINGVTYKKGDLLPNDFGYITSLRVVSSADLMNWTDHGEIDVAGQNGGKGPAMWASHAWAPAVAYKKIDGKDKFFLYFANDASGIGVLEAESPLGPWKDPIQKALLTGRSPGCEGVVWCFDPAVLVDDDGSAYIYFGGGVPNDGKNGEQNNPKTARVAKLGADMISIDGEAKEIDAPCMFEDGGIFKYNDKYYYSYCSNFIQPHKEGYPDYGSICYMVSDDPMGPFTYAGEIFSNPSVWFGTGGNNHHATFVYEGKSYFIYHAQTVSKALGAQKGYRSTHIDKIEMNKDGSIKPIKGTYAGIPQLHNMDPYQRIEAETIAWNAGVKAKPCNEGGALFEGYNMMLTDLQDGDWTSVSQLDFVKGAGEFKVSAASVKGGKIEVRLDSPQGALVGRADVPATGGADVYQTVTCKVANITGTRNIFLIFRGSETENIMNVDYFQFTEKGDEPDPEGPTEQQIADMNAKLSEAKELLSKLSETEKAKLQAAIDAAEDALELQIITKEQFKEIYDDLVTAIKNAQATVKPQDPNAPTASQISEMRDKIAEAKELLDALTGTDRTNLQNAITAAENILEKEDLTKAELQEAFDALSAAVTAAEEIIESKKPLKEQLSNKVAEAEKLLEKLSGAEKEKLQAAITEAKKVLDKEGATDEEIQPVLDRLKGTVKAAEEYLEAEKQLNDKIAEAEEMLEKLSGAEKEKLQAAIDAVKELLKTEGVTKEQLEEALRNLTNAVEESKPVEEQLNNKIAEAEKLLEKLTGADREELQAAIDAAKEILKTEGATKEQLEQVLANLKAAVNKAIEITKPVEERLADKIAAAKKLLETLSADKKAGLEAVIREAETILSKPDATEAEIKAVLDRLIAAIEEAKKPETPPTPPVQEEKPGLNQTFTEANGLTYKVTAYSTAAKTVTVTKASKQLASVTIPDTVVYRKEIFKVTAIGDSAFANQKKLKSAVIGKNIVTIGKKAFLNDKKLVKITFKGTAVKTIGKDAFKNIGKKAVFTMNKNFTAKNLKYKITKCTVSVKEVTVTGSSKKLTSVNVPATVKFNGMTFKVTAINKKAFRKQTKLKSVVIGKNVKNIGSEAFSGAKKLAKVKFSGTAVKTIGKNAFKSIKKNAVFSVKKSKRTYYKKLLKKAKTSNFKMK